MTRVLCGLVAGALLVGSGLTVVAADAGAKEAPAAKKIKKAKKPKKVKNPAARFAKLDADSDDKISLKEMLSAVAGDETKAKRTEAKFKKIDKDGDGFVDLSEFAPLKPAKKPKKVKKPKADK